MKFKNYQERQDINRHITYEVTDYTDWTTSELRYHFANISNMIEHPMRLEPKDKLLRSVGAVLNLQEILTEFGRRGIEVDLDFDFLGFAKIKI